MGQHIPDISAMKRRKNGAESVWGHDIAIIGGGPAGLCFAAGLAGTGLKIIIVEKQAEAVLADPPYDGREIALTHHSYALMKKLGIWNLIPAAKISRIKDAKVLNGKSNYALHFSHTESGKENLGFMIANNEIRRAAYQAVKKSKNVELLTETEVTTVTTNELTADITLSDGKKLSTALVVAADSRFSPTRKMMDIKTEHLDFERTCIVCRMQCEKPHDEVAYECFQYDQTLAVLPLNNQQVSIVVTLDTSDSQRTLAMTPEEFAEDIASRIDGRLGKMKLVSKLFPYPLIGTYADKFYARRYALLGDAAVGMHPVTAHGFNFGLRGGDVLAKQIINAQKLGLDIGSSNVLRQYHIQHRVHTRPLYLGTNALVKIFTRDNKPMRIVRDTLLRLGNRLPPVKKLIMKQLTEAHAA